MFNKKEDLQDIGKMRQALMPLFKEMYKYFEQQRQADFDVLLSKLEKIADTKPIVNVPETKVNVPDVIVPEPKVTIKVGKPDLSGIEALLKNQPEPKVIVETDNPSDYQPHDQGKKGLYKYAGFVRTDGSWYIQRIAKNEQRYAKGVGNYREAWDKRDKLDYGDLG